MLIATLVAADALSTGDLSTAADALAVAGLAPGAPRWVEEGSAADLPLAGDRAAAREALEAALPRADVFVQPAEGRARRLLVADMDSTMITVECIDELADYAGVGRDVAVITERAMRGELDFAAALRARAALLAGLPEAVLDQCLRERVRTTPGARALVRTMRERAGARTCLVTGGFTAFAAPVAAEIGFEAYRANALEVADGRLTGRVLPPVLGAEAKAAALAELAGGLPRETTLAIGDGANDVPMLRAAGFGVAYHAKPRAAEAADAAVRVGDLSALLWAQGYPRAEWAAG